MKKIAISLLAAFSLGLASCDMDKTPYDAISDAEALKTVVDFKNMRVGLYSSLRGLNSGGYVTMSEFQIDNFNAVVGYSNSYGDMHRWQFNANSGEFSSIYGSFISHIGRANFIISNQAQADTTTFEAADQVTVKKIIGEAYFVRAFCIFQVAQYFCQAYDPATAKNPNTGVSYSLEYAPTSDASKYPGRYTLEETYAQIAKDIEEAKARINVPGETASAYITNDVITAFEARVALAKKDYATAAAKAKSLIDGGNYALCASADELVDMWHYDGGAEAIWQLPVTSTNELPGQNGDNFLPYNDTSVPDYIPTGEFISLFQNNDNRINAYFIADEITTTSGASGYVYEFNKFPDESGLWEAVGKVDAGRFTSEPKVFRIAEMYLIAAEAYAQLNDLQNASKYLNEFKMARYAGHEGTQYSSVSNVMQELKVERRIEFAGEGVRLLDLKRWGEGVKRGEPQNMDFCLFPGSNVTTALSKSASDTRMTWPIPQSEMDANPQMKQNPGY